MVGRFQTWWPLGGSRWLGLIVFTVICQFFISCYVKSITSTNLLFDTTISKVTLLRNEKVGCSCRKCFWCDPNKVKTWTKILYKISRAGSVGGLKVLMPVFFADIQQLMDFFQILLVGLKWFRISYGWWNPHGDQDKMDHVV